MHLAIAALYICAALPVLSVVWQIVYFRFFHALSKFPGPFWGTVTRLWLARHTAIGDEAEVLLELHKKYGPVIRISPTMLDVSDSSMLPIIYHRDADKTKYYAPIVPGGPESAFNLQDHKAHAIARKKIARPYSAGAVSKLEPLIDSHIEHWLDRMDELYVKKGDAFDFAHWTTYLTYDVISDIAFGAPLGFVESASDVADLIKGLRTGWLFFGLLSRVYTIKDWLSRVWLVRRLIVTKPDDKSGFGVLMRTRDRLISERVADIKEGKKDIRQDMLQVLLDARDEQGNPLDEGVIQQEVLVILIAGADTTGTSLQAILLTLLRHPSAYARTVAEITAASAAGNLSRPPTPAQVAAHCPFYSACIRETLRLHSPSPNIFPRIVSEPGVEICGRFVPAGMELTANMGVVAHDEALYGSDAGEWKPERWLVAEHRFRKGKDEAREGESGGAANAAAERRIKEMGRLSLAWGYGARVCMGKEIATMELAKAGVELLRRYDLELAGGEERFVVRGGVGWWEDVKVKMVRREGTKARW